MKSCDKFTHCYIVDGRSCLNVIPKIIMDELALQFSEERLKKMVAYNNSQQKTIGNIKYVL